MESANLHQLQNQLHLVGSSSSSSSSSCSSLDNNTDPSFFGVSSSQWSPGGMSLKNVSLSHNYNNEMLKRIHENNNKNNNTSEYMNLSNIQIQQDLPLQWPYDQSSYDLHEGIHRIKEEIYSSTTSNHHQIHQQNMPKFTNMLNIPEITDDTKIGENKDFNDVEAKELLLKTISSGFPINGNYSSNYPSSSLSQSLKGVFSQIHPSVNISSLPESRKMNMETNMRHIPRPFDMNMEMFNGRILEGNVLNSQDISNLVMLRGSLSPYGLPFHQHLQQTLHQNPSSSLSSPTHHMEMLSNDREASEGKMQNVSKKPRVEPRSSCPPFKVRKEKLGDRIAALQQLVSPFGKTDTASVLMEAIGYINFLHNQIETLSVPYMRASRNRTGKASQEESLSQEGEEEESGDLKGRGLCLVPISCMTYVTGDGSGLWPAKPDFGGEI